MRFFKYLNEWKVIYNPSNYMESDGDYVFIYTRKSGLWYADPKGNLYNNNKFITKLVPFETNRGNIFFHDMIQREMRAHGVMLDGQVMGRIKRKTIVVGISQDAKTNEKAIDAIYDYIKEH